jgi:hypothetical protein
LAVCTKLQFSQVRGGLSEPFRFLTLFRRNSVSIWALYWLAWSVTLGDNERDRAAEFLDRYVRLLSAALDEINSSLSPQLHKQNLTKHVAHGISMAGCSPHRD